MIHFVLSIQRILPISPGMKGDVFCLSISLSIAVLSLHYSTSLCGNCNCVHVGFLLPHTYVRAFIHCSLHMYYRVRRRRRRRRRRRSEASSFPFSLCVFVVVAMQVGTGERRRRGKVDTTPVRGGWSPPSVCMRESVSLLK